MSSRVRITVLCLLILGVLDFQFGVHDIVLQQIVELGADVPALTWRDRAALCCG